MPLALVSACGSSHAPDPGIGDDAGRRDAGVDASIEDAGGDSDADVDADAGGGPEDCDPPGPATPQPLTACVVGDLTGVPPEGLETSGDVVDVGHGSPPAGCFGSGQVVGDPDPDRIIDQTWWMRVDDGSDVWTIGVWMPGTDLPVAIGARVSVSFYWFPPEPGYDASGEVRVSIEGGDAILWLSNGSFGLVPTSLTFEPGCVRERDEDSCGTSGRFDVVVTSGAESVEIPYGDRATIGDFMVWNGRYEAPIWNKCDDIYPWRTRLGAVRVP